MNKNKINRKMGIKLYILFSVTALLLLSISCINGEKKEIQKQNEETSQYTLPPSAPAIENASDTPSIVAISNTKMNVLYIGVDNPLKIAVSNYPFEKISVTINNGRIIKRSDFYIVNPKHCGKCEISVFSKEGLISKTEFRVKAIPDPSSYIENRDGGKIKKQDLVAATGVSAIIPNFDFDLLFRVISFTVSITIDGYSQEVKSNNYKLNKEQKSLISKAKSGNEVYFKDIKAVGPDGSVRNMNAMVFTIE